MNKKEKTILLLIVLIIMFIIITLSILISISNSKEGSNDNKEEVHLDSNLEGKELEIEADKQLSATISTYDYYNVKYCAETYISAINELLENNTIENKTKLYSMLNEEYISEEKINNVNIYEKFNKNNKSNIYIDTITSTNLSNNVKAYLVKGKIVYGIYREGYKLIITLDLKNNTFSVYPNEYVSSIQGNKTEAGDILNIKLAEEISQNDYNTYEDQSRKYETISQLYYEKMKSDMLYDYEYLYNMLDSEYRDKRFGNLDNFKNYIYLNNNAIKNAEIEQYSRTYGDGYIEYICVDTIGNHYKFKSTSTMEYTIWLDDYTIETEDFKTKYAAATKEIKVTTNIDKFIKMINNYDYEAAYKLLDATYKNNNLPILDSYKQYISNKFFSRNTCTITNIAQQGQYYVVALTIQNCENEKQTKSAKIIMELGNDTEFVMSFAE